MRVYRQRRGLFVVLLAFALAVGFSSSTAWADEDDDDEEEEDEDLAEARKLYSLGNAHYAAGRYEKAAQAFQKGYELSELPGFLYNLANAFERMGKYSKAADKLELYLESPKAKDVVSVKERVRRLRSAADTRARELEKQRAREEAERRKARLEARERGETDDDFERGPRTNTYLYLLGGAGVALAGSGIFALVSSSAATSAANKCRTGGVCDRGAEADFSREKNFALATDVSLGLGIALAGVGAYLYLKGGPKIRRGAERVADEDDDDADVSVGPLLSPTAIGLGAQGRF